MNRIIQRLPENCGLDIIGDIHGYIAPLEKLLASLGYHGNQPHAEGRQLVFCGDLIDRGPDSPAVVARVMGLVAAGHAQCIMGNHELNILLGETKHGNHWYADPDDAEGNQTAMRDPAAKKRLKEFFEGLPLVLENDQLRIVHACWDPRSIELLRSEGGSVMDVYRRYEQQTHQRLTERNLKGLADQEEASLGAAYADPSGKVPYIWLMAARDAIYQDSNPVRVTASGLEEPLKAYPPEVYGKPLSEPDAEPFFAGGKWRMVRRVKWWNQYQEETPVIFGHYWRNFGTPDLAGVGKFGPDLFEGIEAHHWMGKKNNVYCVDFSVGMRASERGGGHLAAVRFPEWTVVHDEHDSLENAIAIEHDIDEAGRDAMPFRIFVDDNFNYMDESSRYCLGKFESFDAAVTRCKSIVDEFLVKHNTDQIDAESLLKLYTMFGEDPFVIPTPESETRFSAWDYAKQRCEELCEGS